MSSSSYKLGQNMAKVEGVYQVLVSVWTYAKIVSPCIRPN